MAPVRRAVLTACDLTADSCPVCGAVPVQACDRTVLGEWVAFPLPAPWTWWFGPVSVHVHAARVSGSSDEQEPPVADAGHPSASDRAMVARATGGGIQSREMRVEFSDEEEPG